MNIITIKILFWVFAFVFSALISHYFVKTRIAGTPTNEEKYYQYVLNFVGALIGWVALHHLFFVGIQDQAQWFDLVMLFVAYVGITGNLPHLIINKGLNFLSK